MRFAKVDCDANAASAQRFGVDGFPTIVLVTRDGLVFDYTGARNAQALVDYALQRGGWQSQGTAKGPLAAAVALPPSFAWATLQDPHSVVLSDANWAAERAKGEWIVEAYAEWCGHCQTLAPHWGAAATQAHAMGLPLRWGKAETDNGEMRRYDVCCVWCHDVCCVMCVTMRDDA